MRSKSVRGFTVTAAGVLLMLISSTAYSDSSTDYSCLGERAKRKPFARPDWTQFTEDTKCFVGLPQFVNLGEVNSKQRFLLIANFRLPEIYVNDSHYEYAVVNAYLGNATAMRVAKYSQDIAVTNQQKNTLALEFAPKVEGYEAISAKPSFENTSSYTHNHQVLVGSGSGTRKISWVYKPYKKQNIPFGDQFGYVILDLDKKDVNQVLIRWELIYKLDSTLGKEPYVVYQNNLALKGKTAVVEPQQVSYNLDRANNITLENYHTQYVSYDLPENEMDLKPLRDRLLKDPSEIYAEKKKATGDEEIIEVTVETINTQPTPTGKRKEKFQYKKYSPYKDLK